MKKLSTLILILISLFSLKASAQETILGDIDRVQLDKYIKLAIVNFPKKKIAEAQMESAKTAIPISQLSFLDIFNASYFYRPNDRASINVNNPYTVNGFQFGVNLNLGNFLQKPYMVKKAKADFKVAQLQSQDFNLLLETEVKKRYYTYILAGNQLKNDTEAAQDNKNIAETSRSRFEKGEISLDTYNASRMLSSRSNTTRMQTELNYLVAIDALEEIIGMKLSEVK